MKFDALFEAGFKELGARFFLVAFLPALSIALLIVGLDASGAPEASPSWNKLVNALNEFDAAKWIGLVFVVLVASMASMPLQDALVRVLEGYWGRLLLSSWIGQPCLRRQRKRREALLSVIESIPVDAKPAELAAVDSAARRLSKYYPAEERLLPTSLGNALRAAEDLAISRYGLDAVVVWPRLYPFIGARLGGLVDGARNQLDVSARLVPTFLACALIAVGYLFAHGYWLLMPLGFLVMAAFSYRAAVEAAAAFGVTMNAALDLHRFDMLNGLHLPMPADLDAERSTNEAVSAFLRQGIPHGLAYAHPSTNEAASKPTANEPRAS